jgi:hypothetical protein
VQQTGPVWITWGMNRCAGTGPVCPPAVIPRPEKPPHEAPLSEPPGGRRARSLERSDSMQIPQPETGLQDRPFLNPLGV